MRNLNNMSEVILESMIRRVRQIFETNKVIVGGMEGTGSTFVYQIVEGMDVSPVIKVHRYVSGNSPKLVTYRDPRDVICSYARRQLAHLSESDGLEAGLVASHQKLFHELRRHEDLRRYRDDNCALLIRYEDYFGGREDDLIELIAKNLRISINDSIKQRLLTAFSLPRNRERAEQFSTFSEYDETSHIHGKHVSSGGRSGVWKELFTPNVRDMVKEDLGDYLVEFGYAEGWDW